MCWIFIVRSFTPPNGTHVRRSLSGALELCLGTKQIFEKTSIFGYRAVTYRRGHDGVLGRIAHFVARWAAEPSRCGPAGEGMRCALPPRFSPRAPSVANGKNLTMNCCGGCAHERR